MFGLFSGERVSGTYSTSCHEASDAAAGTCSDTAGPYSTYLGGSRYVVIFVDSALRLQRPYGAREKGAAAIFSVVKRFVADMGIPRALRTDNGTEYSNSMFVDFCNSLGIRREFTASYTPQQNGPVERAISRAFKAGHAA